MSSPATDDRRCDRCGRALAPHESSCEGCALAAATRSGARFTKRALAIALAAAALEMGAVWYFFLR